MLLQETIRVYVYFENYTKHIHCVNVYNMLNFFMLKQVVHAITNML
jgi:hypothetical protein